MVGNTLRYLTLFLLFVTVVHAQPLAPTREAQDFTVAYGLYKDGHYQLAYDELNRFINRYPASSRRPEAAFLMAESLVRLGKTEEALDRFERFRREFPGSQLAAEAEFRTGELALEAGRPAEALERFAPIIAGNNVALASEACYWAGEAHYKLGRPDSALAYYRRSIALQPAGRLADYATYSIGWVHQQGGDHARALEAYAEVEKRFPSSPLSRTAAVRRGEVLMDMGDSRNAIAHLLRLRQGLRESDDRAEVTYLLGEGYFKTNQFTQARAWYDSFLTQYAGHRLERDVQYGRAWTFLQEKKGDEAAAAFLGLASGNDRIAHASGYRAGVALKLAGKPAEAEKAFRRVSAAPGGEFADDALCEIGVLHFEKGAYDSALAVFNRVLSAYPAGDSRARALFMIGEVHRAKGALDAALLSYRDARSQQSVTPELLADILYEEGLTLQRLGRHGEAVATLRSFVAQFPGDAQVGEAWFWMGEAAFHESDYARADSAYGLALKTLEGPRAADALYGKAWSLYRMGDYRNAMMLFTRLIAQHPKSSYVSDARLRIGDCYTSLREYTRAIAVYREVLKANPQGENADYARYQLGGALVRANQAAQGIREYELLIARSPASPYADDARYAIGWVYFQQKNYARAMKEFREAIRAYPESELVPRILCSLGDAQYNTGDYAAAAASYKEVLKSHPQSSSVLDATKGIRDAYAALNKEAEGEAVVAEFLKGNPAATMADRVVFRDAEERLAGEDYEAALRLYTDLLKNHPQSTLVPDATLGAAKANLALGRTQEAERLFRSVADRHPGKPAAALAMLGLGRLLSQQLRPLDALEMFERVEAEFPNSAQAGEARLERARTLRGEGDSETALTLLGSIDAATFSEALAARARVEAAAIHLEKNRYDEAASLYTAVAQSRSDDLGAEAQYGSAEVLYARGDVEAGIAAFARVRYLYPGSREWIGRATLRMGDGYAKLGQPLKARELYASVASEYKDSGLGSEAAKRLGELK